MENKLILIVKESLPHRMLISKVIESYPSLDVIGGAENGAVAVHKIEQLQADLSLPIQVLARGISTVGPVPSRKCS